MKNKTILWVDDDIDKLTGLEAYLGELDNLNLLTATSTQEAQEALENNVIEMLMFDMVLMQDNNRVALGRNTGIDLAQVAIGKGIRLFIAYTVLTPNEVKRAWKRIPKSEESVKFIHLSKATAIARVVAAVETMIEG